MLPTNPLRTEWITAIVGDCALSVDALDAAQSLADDVRGLSARSFTDSHAIGHELPHLGAVEILDALGELKKAGYLTVGPYGALSITLPTVAV